MSLARKGETHEAELLMLMIRTEPGDELLAAAVILGMIRLVKRKWPTWFVANNLRIYQDIFWQGWTGSSLPFTTVGLLKKLKNLLLNPILTHRNVSFKGLPMTHHSCIIDHQVDSIDIVPT